MNKYNSYLPRTLKDMLAMLALCSQENPPTPLSILFNSEGPKNSVRILCPEFSMSVSEPLTCSSWKRN